MGSFGLEYPLLITSFKNYEELKKRFPKRSVKADIYAPFDEAFYWTRTGKFRTLTLPDYKIWEPAEWPMRKRIR